MKVIGEDPGDIVFQPTLPARGATGSAGGRISHFSHFNPRSPHGERLYLYASAEQCLVISTHAPRAGSDG